MVILWHQGALSRYCDEVKSNIIDEFKESNNSKV
jgi:hypothetical protein